MSYACRVDATPSFTVVSDAVHRFGTSLLGPPSCASRPPSPLLAALRCRTCGRRFPTRPAAARRMPTASAATSPISPTIGSRAAARGRPATTAPPPGSRGAMPRSACGPLGDRRRWLPPASSSRTERAAGARRPAGRGADAERRRASCPAAIRRFAASTSSSARTSTTSAARPMSALDPEARRRDPQRRRRQRVGHGGRARARAPASPRIPRGARSSSRTSAARSSGSSARSGSSSIRPSRSTAWRRC